MTKLHETPTLNRVFYSQNNNINGITLICISGIHGNEPAGYYGLKKVVNSIVDNKTTLNGNFYALLGNINAFKNGVRFCDTDLNRLWTKNEIETLKQNLKSSLQESKEQLELYNEIKKILNAHQGPFVFIDLHTTSSPTTPFITISDSLNNRDLANKFNMPIILGIEEFIEGPLLTYINEFGHVSMGFEAGQHEDKNSVLNCEAFVWLILNQLNVVTKNDFPFDEFSALLSFKKSFYKIIYRHSITSTDNFEMLPDFNNFENIRKNQVLAQHESETIRSLFSGMIFMPLYQKKGNDGFFIIRKISRIWLLLSAALRNLKFYHILRILPGIKEHPKNKYCLIVNKQIAFFLTTKLFHLLGYRKKIKKENKWYFIKRDRPVSEFS